MQRSYFYMKGLQKTAADKSVLTTRSNLIAGLNPLYANQHSSECSCFACLMSSRNMGSGKSVNEALKAELHKKDDTVATPGSPGGPSKKLPQPTAEDMAQLAGSHPELEDILKNNREFVKKMNEQDPTFFTKLGKGQKPKYFYIGCADSRVDPNAMFGLPKGSIFISRNVGNVVMPGDMNLHASLEFSVGALGVSHIIVCGHYDCGAVRASLGDMDYTKPKLPPLVEYWTRSIRDVSRLYATELGAIDNIEERNRRLVELNVIEGCLSVFKVGMVQRLREESRKKGGRYLTPRVHGLVFDPADGILHKLNLNWKKDLDKLRKTYDLREKVDDPSKMFSGDQLKAN